MTSLSGLVGDDVPHQPAHLARVPAGNRNALKFLCTAASQKMSDDCDAEAWLLAGGNSLSLFFFFFLGSSTSASLALRDLQSKERVPVSWERTWRVKNVFGSVVLHTLSARRVLPLKTFCSSGL